MPISQTESYLENTKYLFLEESLIFLLTLKWKHKEKAFWSVKTKTNSSFAVKVTGKSNHSFYCLFDESRSSDICTIMELKELNWLCKHTENVKSSQPCIQWILVLNQVKHKFFHVSIVNRLCKQEFADVSKEAIPIVHPRTSTSNILNRSGKSICQLVQKLGERKKNIKRYTLAYKR